MAVPPPIRRSLRVGDTVDRGRYKLVRILGAGGNGVVWLAHHSAMNSLTVIKFPNSRVCAEEPAQQQFEQEIRALVSFSNRHPNIVNILDVGHHHGQPYVVMQYLTRGSLREFVFGSAGFSSPEAVTLHQSPSWLLSIADALDFVHTHGLVHRDIKPGNILLDDSFSAYLADFGIATLVDRGSASAEGAGESSRQTHVVGSLPYMAPEVLQGEKPHARSEQFSLAVTVYEYLVGTRPFAATNSTELVNAQRSFKVQSICDHRSELPERMWDVIRRALHPNADERFDSCSQFAREASHVWTFVPLAASNSTRTKCRRKPPLPGDETHGSNDVTQQIAGARDQPATKPLPLPNADETDTAKLRRKIKLSRIMRDTRQEP